LLPQFSDNDKPTWRGDINGAFSAIDNAHTSMSTRLNNDETTLAGLADAAHTGAANQFTQPQTVPTLQLGADNTNPVILTSSLGTSNSSRVSIQPKNAATSTAPAQLELIPGTLNDSSNSIPSQILLFNKVGDNYERFTFTCVDNEFLIESTFNGTGVARNIIFEMGGSVSNNIAGQPAITMYSDASVDLEGGSFVADGKTWGVNRTRVADHHDSGDSRLVIDTRTKTPADNAADSASIQFMRGGTAKWHVGLNYAGRNQDDFDFVNALAGVVPALSLGSGATPRVGFLGKAPIARAATPVTLADVITVLQNFGLVS
jgi:hypothetical protein